FTFDGTEIDDGPELARRLAVNGGHLLRDHPARLADDIAQALERGLERDGRRAAGPILQHEQPALQADQAILRRSQRLLEAAENGKRLDALAGGVAHRVGDLAAQL